MELLAKKRIIVGHKVKKLRDEGKIPASLYGKKVSSQNIEVNLKDFLKVYAEARDTKLVDLKLGDKIFPVLIHQIQKNPVSDVILNADFLAVDLKAAVRVHVPVSSIGSSPAVADKLGALLNPLQEVEIECLPTDLPEKLEVDISGLKAIGDAAKVSDIKVSEKIKILTPLDQVIFTLAELVQKEKVEEVVAPTEVEATAEKKPEEGAAAEAPAGKGEATASESKKPEKKVEAKK
jgi:large subunit ribosomal protein L25